MKSTSTKVFLQNGRWNQRRKPYKATRKTFLIVCEGQKTEPEYFRAFPLETVQVEGIGFNTVSLVKEAIRLKKKRPERQEIWCVLDRDSFPAKDIKEALRLADQNNIRIAFSNESFELWYLLHFVYLDTKLCRGDYIKKLKKHLRPLGIEYEKQGLYGPLKSFQQIAIKSAQRLLQNHTNRIDIKHQKFKDRYGSFDVVKANPFTTVHDLVLTLLQEIEKKH